MISLLIEPNKTLANIIKTSLESYGYIVDYDDYIPKQLNYLSVKKYDIIFCTTSELINTGKTESTACKIRRLSPNSVLIGIQSSNNLDEKINFLNCGGDDVVTYPFPMREFLARIQASLRRPHTNNHNQIKASSINVNTLERRIYESEKEIPLCRKEYNILEYLVRNKNRTVTRNELMDHIWEYKRVFGSNTVDVHISRLRDKIQNKYLIQTIHGIGYRLNDKEEVREDKVLSFKY